MNLIKDIYYVPAFTVIQERLKATPYTLEIMHEGDLIFFMIEKM